MRQSDGNKTEKTLAAARLSQGRLTDEEECGRTLECPANPTLASLARIRSSVLLKTASSAGVPTGPRSSSLPPKPATLQYSGDDDR